MVKEDRKEEKVKEREGVNGSEAVKEMEEEEE